MLPSSSSTFLSASIRRYRPPLVAPFASWWLGFQWGRSPALAGSRGRRWRGGGGRALYLGQPGERRRRGRGREAGRGEGRARAHQLLVDDLEAATEGVGQGSEGRSEEVQRGGGLPELAARECPSRSAAGTGASVARRRPGSSNGSSGPGIGGEAGRGPTRRRFAGIGGTRVSQQISSAFSLWIMVSEAAFSKLTSVMVVGCCHTNLGAPYENNRKRHAVLSWKLSLLP